MMTSVDILLRPSSYQASVLSPHSSPVMDRREVLSPAASFTFIIRFKEYLNCIIASVVSLPGVSVSVVDHQIDK